VDREVEKIDPVERAILRIGVYELLHKPETPYRVVINEGVELAKSFGAPIRPRHRRVKFLPLAWAGMPKTSFRKNSDSPL
jgi:hypothetical protein